MSTAARNAGCGARAAVRHVERYLERPFADGYRSELLPQLPYWLQAVMGPMDAGAMLFVDYGYPRGEYYLPERSDGTCMGKRSRIWMRASKLCRSRL